MAETSETNHKPQEKMSSLLIGVLLTAASDTIEGIRKAGRGAAKSVAIATEDMVRTIEDSESGMGESFGSSLLKLGKQTAIRGLHTAVEVAEKLHIISPVNIYTLPKLVEDDEEKDISLKSEIIEHLRTEIAINSPFYEEMELIANRCFDLGIDPDKVIAFFESDQVLNMIIEDVVDNKYSRYSPLDLNTAVSTALNSIALKLKGITDRLDKVSVDQKTESEIITYFEYFKKTYNPTDSEHTIYAFIQKLEEKFSSYDIANWIKRNKHLFAELMRGTNGQRHIRNMVHSAYEKRGKQFPERFVEVRLSRFLEIKKVSGSEKIAGEEDVILIDCNELRDFFGDILPRIYTKEVDAVRIRRILIEKCIEKVESVNDKKRREGQPELKSIYVREGETVERKDFDNFEEMKAEFEGIVSENAKTISSHIDITNLLEDSERTPENLKHEYLRFFDEEGKLNRQTYNRTLRSIFEMVGGASEERESIFDIKDRVADIYEKVNDYLHNLYRTQGISTSLDFELVRNTNDYAQLVYLACRGETKELRFAARRKLELGWLVYSCVYTPRYVFRHRDAGAIKQRLESFVGGIKVDAEAQLEEMHFIDNEEGQVELIDDPSTLDGGEQRLNTVKLIPATFCGVHCHLLPVKNGATGEDDESTRDTEYIGIKSLRSMVTKLIRGEKTRAKDITDIIRMTIVADSIEALAQIQEKLENRYVSFGRNLRRENRYGQFVRVSTFNTTTNSYKSDEYRTLRYVVDVPIQDETGGHMYLAPIEIRVLLREDLAKEKSSSNDASHINYESKRARVCIKRLEPPTISPELYKTTGPQTEDIFGHTSVVLKDRSDFAEIA